MTQKQLAILAIWLGIYTVLKVLQVHDWIIWMIVLIVFLMGVVDYCWLNGRLSGRSFNNVK